MSSTKFAALTSDPIERVTLACQSCLTWSVSLQRAAGDGETSMPLVKEIIAHLYNAIADAGTIFTENETRRPYLYWHELAVMNAQTIASAAASVVQPQLHQAEREAAEEYERLAAKEDPAKEQVRIKGSVADLWREDTWVKMREALATVPLIDNANEIALRIRQECLEATAQAKPVEPQKSSSSPSEQISGIARAIAYMQDRAKVTGKLPTAPEVVQVTGMSRAALYREPGFVSSRKAIKEMLAPRIPKGSKDAAGNLDAEDLDD